MIYQKSKVKIINLLRSRGDTDPINFKLSNKKTKKPIDITSDSFTLSVSDEEFPIDANYLFQSTGAILDGFKGSVSFPVIEAVANELGGKYYDVQRTYGGVIKTIIRGQIQFEQDITK